MSNVYFQSGHAPCDFYIRSHIFLLSAIINYFSSLFSKSLLKRVYLEFYIETE